MKSPICSHRCNAVIILLAALPWAVSGAPPVQVDAADPTSAPQGTLGLDITVTGSGFDSSAQVEFLVTGTTNPGGITVRKVKVTGPKKLIATVDVADTAVIANFDIQVQLSGGRKGKGTSLFAVLAKTSNDACAVPQIDFPAFTFRGTTEATEEQIYIADATGTCIRPLYEVTTKIATDAASAVFSYPVAGTADVGRIVWKQGGSRQIFGLTFSVTGTSITPYSAELLYETVGPHISALDMSKDGSIVYAALDTVGPTDASRIIAITLSDRSYREIYVGPADSSDIGSISIDESGALYVQQTVPIQQNVFSQILKIAPGCADPSCAVVLATDESTYLNDMVNNVAVSLESDRLVYDHLGITACSPVLKILSRDGSPVVNGAPPFYGRRSSWYRGKILTDGFKMNKRNGGCIISSTISQFDPETGAETILVRGYDPDGR